jgi:hypothetical protein
VHGVYKVMTGKHTLLLLLFTTKREEKKERSLK